MVKVDAELLDDLGNLAGEHSIIRGRIEQQVNDAQFALNEMETTLERMRDQLLRLDIETQGESPAASSSKAMPMTISTRWKWTAIRSCSSCRGPVRVGLGPARPEGNPGCSALRRPTACCSSRRGSTASCRKA
jgi:hypothetical protein